MDQSAGPGTPERGLERLESLTKRETPLPPLTASFRRPLSTRRLLPLGSSPDLLSKSRSPLRPPSMLMKSSLPPLMAPQLTPLPDGVVTDAPADFPTPTSPPMSPTVRPRRKIPLNFPSAERPQSRDSVLTMDAIGPVLGGRSLNKAGSSGTPIGSRTGRAHYRSRFCPAHRRSQARSAHTQAATSAAAALSLAKGEYGMPPALLKSRAPPPRPCSVTASSMHSGHQRCHGQRQRACEHATPRSAAGANADGTSPPLALTPVPPRVCCATSGKKRGQWAQSAAAVYSDRCRRC